MVLAGVASPVVGAVVGARLAGVVELASPAAAAAAAGAAVAVAKAEVEVVAEVAEPVLAGAVLEPHLGQVGDEPEPQVWVGLLFSQPQVRQ